MNKALVSVVMPVYNCQQYVAQSLDSVVGQTYQDWELVVVDDCSSDGTAEIVRNYARRDGRIRLIRSDKNAGPAAARNRAIDESRGRYIAFLDGDDLWAPAKLEVQLRAMREGRACFSFTSYVPFSDARGEMPIVRAPTTVDYRMMLRGSVIGCLTVVYDSSVLGKRYFPEKNVGDLGLSFYSRFIERLGHEDYALWLEILRSFESELYADWAVVGVDLPLAQYRVRGDSFSSNKKKTALYTWIIYRHCENLGLLPSAYYLSVHSLNRLFKYRGRGNVKRQSGRSVESSF